MCLVVVGSVALDTITTPAGTAKEALGGSATYFSLAASHFAPVKLVAVVGEDFPKKGIDLFKERQVDVTGLERRPGRTFRWEGVYSENLNHRETKLLELNVFAEFKPVLPESYRDAPMVFLANIDPDLQLDVLRQIKKPKLVACDTMNHWIATKHQGVVDLFKRVDAVMMNEEEAKMFAKTDNLVKAGRTILEYGPKLAVIKKGEYGSLAIAKDWLFSAPAFPLEEVKDPTGAGDTFAGGLFGYLAKQKNPWDPKAIRQGMLMGTVMASYCVQEFSVDRLVKLDQRLIQLRYDTFLKLITP